MPYLSHFSLTNRPFSLTSDPKCFYKSNKSNDVLEGVIFSIERNAGLTVVTGDVGTGKTLLCKRLEKEIQKKDKYKDNFIFINDPIFNSEELIDIITTKLNLTKENLSHGESISAIKDNILNLKKKNKQPILLIDNAENLDEESFKILTFINDLEKEETKLVPIIIVGQKKLEDKLKSSRLSGFNQRIDFLFKLSKLDKKETEEYINYRINLSREEGVLSDIFSKQAIELVYKHSNGTHRIINSIADKALISAYADKMPFIKTKHINDALKELFVSPEIKEEKSTLKLLIAIILISASISIAIKPSFKQNVKNLLLNIKQKENIVKENVVKKNIKSEDKKPEASYKQYSFSGHEQKPKIIIKDNSLLSDEAQAPTQINNQSETVKTNVRTYEYIPIPKKKPKKALNKPKNQPIVTITNKPTETPEDEFNQRSFRSAPPYSIRTFER